MEKPRIGVPEAKTSAPALSRGLAVLASLDPNQAETLEQISSRLGFPKASVLRLLETLESLGLIRKTRDKRYEALWRLEPMGDPRKIFRQTLEATMLRLCEETGCTVEWYEAGPEGMRLVRQTQPDRELCVQARPGFLRDWKTEFEAVARLGHAFAQEAPALRSTQQYVANGEMGRLSLAQIRDQLEQARQDAATGNLFFNSNGVRRHAAAAFSGPDRQFLGVLALAEAYHFNAPSEPNDFLATLRSALQHRQ